MSTKKTGQPDILLSEATAAEVLGVSIWTVRRERKAGSLPYVTVRGSVRIATSCLNAYIAARTFGASA